MKIDLMSVIEVKYWDFGFEITNVLLFSGLYNFHSQIAQYVIPEKFHQTGSASFWLYSNGRLLSIVHTTGSGHKSR